MKVHNNAVLTPSGRALLVQRYLAGESAEAEEAAEHFRRQVGNLFRGHAFPVVQEDLMLRVQAVVQQPPLTLASGS